MSLRDKVVNLALDGKTVNYISNELGVTRTDIANALIAHLNSKDAKDLSIVEESNRDKNTREISIKYSGKIKTLDEVIQGLEIDMSEWEVSNVTYNEWEGQRPNDQGTIVLHQIKVSFKRIKLIANFEIPTAINFTLKNDKKAFTKKAKSSSIKTAVILPDMQVGFRRDLITGKLVAVHDRAAMDVALQITKYVNPDRIILLGDNLDLPQESKYPSGPEFYFTTQASAVELAWWLAQLRMIDPDMEIDYIEGNHCARLNKNLMQNAVAAYGLKSVGDLNGAPMLSVEKLLGLDSLGIRYHGNYPAGKVVLNDNLVCIHGEIAKGESGATVSAVVKDTRVSVIQGHIHRYEVATKTLWSANDTAHMYTAASFGCLCKIDPGAVPGFKSHQNWQQGMGIVYYEDSGVQQFRQEFVPIINGRAILQSEIFNASEETDIIESIESDMNFKVS